MKKLVLYAAVLSQTAWAQVNLDAPISIGGSDLVFRSAVDPNSAYLFPLALRRVTPAAIVRQKNRLLATFKVGIALADYQRVESEFLKAGHLGEELRILKPLSTSLSSAQGSSVSPEFDPVVEVHGDAGSFLVPMEYTLNVKRRPQWFEAPKANELFSRIFGVSGSDCIGVIHYEFNAVALGKPYLAQSSIGIFVSGEESSAQAAVEQNHTRAKIHRFLTAVTQALRPSESILNTSSHQMIIQHDERSACWNTGRPGEICLRTLE